MTTAALLIAACIAATQPSGSVQDRIARTWPGDDRAALSVAKCESSFDPTARNGVHIGLFQLSGRYHRGRAARLGYSWEQMAQVEPNVRVAWDLYSEQKWRPWSCKPR